MLNKQIRRQENSNMYLNYPILTWAVPLHATFKKCQSPDVFSRVWLATQTAAHYPPLEPAKGFLSQKWACWAWAFCFCLQCWKNFRKCIGERNLFLLLSPPQHLLSPDSSLHSFIAVGWKGYFTAAVATSSLSFNYFLTSQSFQITEKQIFCLASFLSALSLLLHAACSCTLKFRSASLYEKHTWTIKEGVFQGATTKVMGVLRRINNCFTYVASKHFPSHYQNRLHSEAAIHRLRFSKWVLLLTANLKHKNILLICVSWVINSPLHSRVRLMSRGKYPNVTTPPSYYLSCTRCFPSQKASGGCSVSG